MFSFGSSEPVCWFYLDVFGFVQTKKRLVFFTFSFLVGGCFLLQFFFFLDKPDGKPDPQTEKNILLIIC